MASKVQPKILEAAIKLFGTYGFKGVTTRDLAKEADVVEGSIYLCFKSKENLYQQAINSVLSRQVDLLGKYLLGMHSGPQPADPAQRVGEMVKIWYSSLSQPAARLLQMAMIADSKRYQVIRDSFDQIINLIADTLGGQKESGTTLRRTPGTAAKALVHALFQVKVSYRKLTDVETESQAIIEDWLLTVAVNG